MTGIRTVEVTFPGLTLGKDLTENQALCRTCKGVGLVVRDYIYGIQGERRTDGKPLSYNRPYIGVCPDCYFGVQNVCQHCHKPIKPRHSLICTCDGATAERWAAEAAKMWAKVDKAQKMTLAEAVAADVVYVYSEGHDRYYSLDEFDDLDLEDAKTMGVVWATTETRMGFDAGNLIDNACEDLHEDARDNIGSTEQAELQALLDAWAEKYGKHTTTYYPDYRRVILVGALAPETLAGAQAGTTKEAE